MNSTSVLTRRSRPRPRPTSTSLCATCRTLRGRSPTRRPRAWAIRHGRVRPGQDRRGSPAGTTAARTRAAFSPLLVLMWVALVYGAVTLFGIGGGDRPLAIVLIIAAFAFLKRLFGFGGRRRGPRGPKGPRRGQGPRF